MGYLTDLVNRQSKRIYFQKSNYHKTYENYLMSSLEGYDLDEIEKNLKKRDCSKYLDEMRRIVLVRVTNVLSYQISKGEKKQYLPLLEKLLTVLIKDLVSDYESYGADFMMIELYFAITNSKSLLSTKVYLKCVNLLATLDPWKHYKVNSRNKPIKEQHNFVIYSIVGEHLRQVLTGVDTSIYIEENWKIQKEKFEINGMYRDPNNPMLYDLTVRMHLALMLQTGYQGAIVKDIKDILSKSAMTTLFYSSTNYIFPYGGRSNGYHMNEALLASLSEYYAQVFYDQEDIKLAGAFKHLGRKSMEALSNWPNTHIKNYYDNHSMYGCDSYGTYEGYMVTAGCFIMPGVMFSNEDINEYTTPQEFGGYVFSTSDDFHKIFANNNGYSVQIDTNADNHYDSTGLGRVHKVNTPSELILSMPFSLHPKFLLGEHEQTQGRALGVGWNEDGKEVYLAEQKMLKSATLHVISENEKNVSFSVTYYIEQGIIIETYILNKDGVYITCESDFTNLFYHIPVLIDNGKEKMAISITPKGLVNSLNDFEYHSKWSKKYEFVLEDNNLFNRSGQYRSLKVYGNKKQISLQLSIMEKRKK